MISDISWIIILIIFAIAGLKRPYIALSCVIFVDILKPQNLSFSILANKPLSLIFTLIFFISLLINFRKCSIPNKKNTSVFLLLFMFWITITTQYAEFQYAAWYKYDYSIKTLLFALFIPFVLNSRIKIEFFIMIMISAIAYFIINGGMKTLFGTTGYGLELVFSRVGDSGITETSTLSMVSAFCLPFIYYLHQYSIFNNKWIKRILLALSFAAILTVIGTHARTGLVGLFVLSTLVLLKSQKKIKVLSSLFFVLILVISFAPQNWLDRMNTLTTANKESSAYGRLVVWKWTIDYVSTRPILGGGFMSFKANAGQLGSYSSEDQDVDLREKGGKAFHNVFFEVLGEHGYVGVFLYLSIIFYTWRNNRGIISNKGSPPWAKSLSQVNTYALIVFCACGMFIGVAFSPWLYYFAGISGGLSYLHNKELPSTRKNRVQTRH
jgi:probable O-glycosylation ligase (exosortase A-associated)